MWRTLEVMERFCFLLHLQKEYGALMCVFEECLRWAKTDRQWNLESVAAYFY